MVILKVKWLYVISEGSAIIKNNKQNNNIFIFEFRCLHLQAYKIKHLVMQPLFTNIWKILVGSFKTSMVM